MEDGQAHDLADLVGLTGMSEELAMRYLEAYGSLEVATNQFFDGNEPPATANPVVEDAVDVVVEEHFEYPEWHELVW
jgi:hypothetical protein